MMVRNVELEARTRVIPIPQQLAQTGLAALDWQIEQALTAKVEVIALDMQAVQGFDSASLNWLLDLQARLAGRGLQLFLKNPSNLCMDVLLATRLDQRLKMDPADATEVQHA